MRVVEDLGGVVGVKPACAAMNVSRATLYRRRSRQTTEDKPPSTRAPALKLSEDEREAVVEVLHSARFVDASPHTIYATLLEENVYHCSVRTMYCSGLMIPDTSIGSMSTQRGIHDKTKFHSRIQKRGREAGARRWL